MITSVLCAHGGDLDDRLATMGFVDVGQSVPHVMVELMYGRDDNFTGRRLYEGLDRAWLHPDAAISLARAQEMLDSLMPGYRLLIKDAARPMSVQRRMFRTVAGTPQARYVANPAKGGGLHNYGLAVDITLADASGRELPMGTPVDHLGPEANIDREEQLVRQGVISETERQNRLLLRRVMRAAGFSTIRTEWWHFNRVSKSTAQARYKLLDF